MKAFSIFGAKSGSIAMMFLALTSVASASEIRMHVPVAARWGAEMLPAGDYKFSFSNASPYAQVSGNGKMAVVMITSATSLAERERSLLQIVNVNGTPTVAGFDSGELGITYRFVVPKANPPHRTVVVAAASGM